MLGVGAIWIVKRGRFFFPRVLPIPNSDIYCGLNNLDLDCFGRRLSIHTHRYYLLGIPVDPRDGYLRAYHP